MSDPSLALQGAINTTLRAASTGAGMRVLDRVPENVVFPFIEIGEVQAVSDGSQCGDGFEVYPTIHVWSRAVGQVEVKTIAGQVRTALHEASLSLGSDWQFHHILHQDTRYLKDPDGVTSHAALTFRALVSAA